MRRAQEECTIYYAVTIQSSADEVEKEEKVSCRYRSGYNRSPVASKEEAGKGLWVRTTSVGFYELLQDEMSESLVLSDSLQHLAHGVPHPTATNVWWR
eukprot:gene3998-2853_t